MKSLTLKQRLTAAFVLVAALTLAISSLLFYRTWLDYAVRSEKVELLKQGEVLARNIEASRNASNGPRIAERLLEYSGRIVDARIIMTDQTGAITFDSNRFSKRIEPAQIQRLGRRFNEGRRVVGSRNLPKLDASVAFTSVPLRDGSGDRLLLISLVRDIKRAQGPALRILFISGIISFLIASIAGFYLALRLARPIEKLKVAARNMGRGLFLQNVPVAVGDEIGELTHAFNMMSATVDKAYSLEREFASNVSHELKTPLTSIEGFSKVLLDGQVNDEEQRRKYLKIIYTESRRVSKLVNDLLSLARIDTGSFKLQQADIDTKVLLSNIYDKFLPFTEGKGLALNMSTDGFIFKGDEAVVEQVIGNLVENAIKYTGESGSVNVSAEVAGRNICFMVKDTGVGIPPEDQPKIFERFYRAGTSGSAKGAGLGLSVCQALVKFLGGTIEVFSLPGKGTEFRVLLPKI